MDLLYIDANGYGRLTQWSSWGEPIEYATRVLSPGQYVRIDDGRRYPQLCAGGGYTGRPIVYRSPAQLARACGARLYRTEAGYRRAIERASEN